MTLKLNHDSLATIAPNLQETRQDLQTIKLPFFAQDITQEILRLGA
jgi:hypothetical protein